MMAVIFYHAYLPQCNTETQATDTNTENYRDERHRQKRTKHAQTENDATYKGTAAVPPNKESHRALQENQPRGYLFTSLCCSNALAS